MITIARGEARDGTRNQLSSPGLTGAIQYSDTFVIEPRGRGVLDGPVKPGHDDVLCGPSGVHLKTSAFH